MYHQRQARRKNLLEVAHDNENEEYYKKLPEPCEDELDMLDLAFGLSET
ncbi:mitochondrial ferredoxin, partial [Haematococcus lacustris]